MTETMLTRMARAIEQELGVQELVLADPLTLKRLQASRAAKAALEAIREDSEDLWDVAWRTGHDPYEPPHPKDVWENQIRAILQGEA